MLRKKPLKQRLNAPLQKFESRYFGNKGEQIACNYLSLNAYKIISRNFRSRFGEIDIIAVKRGILIFCEVKTRWSNKFGSPEEAVTFQKLGRIRKAAEYFSLLHPELPKRVAIEVVAIDIQRDTPTSIRIIRVDNI